MEANTASVKEYLTKKEVATLLRCTTRCIDAWMTRGMPHYRFGGRKTLFKPGEVDKFVTEKCRTVRGN